MRTRNGYDGETPDSQAQAGRRLAARRGALWRPAESDLPLQFVRRAVRAAEPQESAVAIVVGVRSRSARSARAHVEKVDLQVSAFNVEGKLFGSTRTARRCHHARGRVRALPSTKCSRGSISNQAGINCASPPTSAASQRAAACTTTDVPDFWAAPVSLSALS